MKEFLLLVIHVVLLVFSEDIPNSTCGDICCNNFHKDKFDGSCVECPLGTHGMNCTGTCPPQYYGRRCHSKCECPIKLCDIKYGCMDFQTTKGGDKTWMYVAFVLIGFIATVLVARQMSLMKYWCAKRCKEEIIVSNQSQTGMGNLIPNSTEENKYEGPISSPSHDEMDTVHLYNMSDENNYADLRTSALYPIYDNPDDLDTNLTGYGPLMHFP